MREGKTIKNRLHLDISVGGDRSVSMQERNRRVDAEAQRLVALGATLTGPVSTGGLDHYAVAMTDPEGNESTDKARCGGLAGTVDVAFSFPGLDPTARGALR